MSQPIIVEAVFENGVLRPVQSLPLSPSQHVMLTIQVPDDAEPWPADVAAIYAEIAEEDRRLAEAFSPTVRETWPRHEE